MTGGFLGLVGVDIASIEGPSTEMANPFKWPATLLEGGEFQRSAASTPRLPPRVTAEGSNPELFSLAAPHYLSTEVA